MEVMVELWNPSWNNFPWKSFTNPKDRYEFMPTFVVGEMVFIFLALALLAHAVKQGRVHVVIWLASLISGTANDAFFMALPLVDNFWQAQASIMLTPRMPLYIPCVYVTFMYTASVAAWRLGRPSGILGGLSLAALAGLMGEMIYSPYDITGAKFLWWTWHDTDAPVRDRLFGAPVGSTCWVITFTASFQFLLQLCLPKDAIEGKSDLGLGTALFSLITNALLATPLMLVVMTTFQFISADPPGLPTVNHTFLAVLTAFGLLALRILLASPTKNLALKPTSRRADLTINLLLVLLFAYWFVNMVVGVPETHVSTGVHQELGPCHVKALDMSGQERQVYLCRESYDEDFDFNCKASNSRESSEWYTICGKPHKNKETFVAAIGVLALVGSTVFTRALSALYI